MTRFHWANAWSSSKYTVGARVEVSRRDQVSAAKVTSRDVAIAAPWPDNSEDETLRTTKLARPDPSPPGRCGKSAPSVLAGLLISVIAATSVAADPAGAETAAAAGGSQSVAFAGFRIINDSLEPLSEAERERARMLDRIAKKEMSATGRFEFVDIPNDIAQEMAKGPDIGECNGCEVDYGRRLGADLIGWGTVQKVSNLILNLNLYLADVETGKMTYVKSVDIRGNNDRSWRKGLEWMLEHYMPGSG